MKTTIVHNRDEFLAALGPDGRVKHPIKLAELSGLSGLTSVTSLDGVTLAEGSGLSGLTSVTSLEGVTLAEGSWLSGLTYAGVSFQVSVCRNSVKMGCVTKTPAQWRRYTLAQCKKEHGSRTAQWLKKWRPEILAAVKRMRRKTKP